MQIVTVPQVSPDGKWVAYVVSTNDRGADETRSAIWMVSWDGTQQIPLTNPAHDISSPRWSLDGRYLSYLAIPTGTDKSQVMLLDRRGGEARALRPRQRAARGNRVTAPRNQRTAFPTRKNRRTPARAL
jgi:Tol biopolymer transport system component